MERHLLLSSCLNRATGDSLFLHPSEEATGAVPEPAGLGRERRWRGSSSQQQCGLRPQNCPLKPVFLLIWASREIDKAKILMKWTVIDENSELRSLNFDEN